MDENLLPRPESHEDRVKFETSHDFERTVTSHRASHARSDPIETSTPVVPAAITIEQFETILKMLYKQQQQNLLLLPQVLQSLNASS